MMNLLLVIIFLNITVLLCEDKLLVDDKKTVSGNMSVDDNPLPVANLVPAKDIHVPHSNHTIDKFFQVYKTRYLDTEPCDPNNPTHFMCHLLEGPIKSPYCYHFELFAMTTNIIRRILSGHNGLRNLEAKHVGWEVSNMNLLHWDKDLAWMAEQRLYHCDPNEVIDDTYIRNNHHTVAKNNFTMKGYPGRKKWLSAAIHSWFNHTTKGIPQQFRKPIILTPYIILIYPRAKFIGCAIARFNHGTTFICYYGPQATEENVSDSFKRGRWCTQCEASRSTCSLIFDGLCGMDLFSGSIRIHSKFYWLLFVILIGLI